VFTLACEETRVWHVSFVGMCSHNFDILTEECVHVCFRYKDLQGVYGLEKFLDGKLTIEGCHKMVRHVYDADYKPKTAPADVTVSATKKLAKKRKSVMDDDDGGDVVPAVAQRDELAEYLTSSTHNLTKTSNPLHWWKDNAPRFPTVALMARNYLGCPATTAGLERMFSSAGRTHNDLKKKTKETTIETRMMAKYNN
jgi:hypothetical protein